MPEQPSLKLLFVINPKSGIRKDVHFKWGKQPINWEEEINTYLKNTPHLYRIYHVSTGDDRNFITYLIERFQPDRIAAVGGDGTLKMVTEAMQGMDIPICVFPAGSANGMAREIGMPYTVAECMKVLLEGEAKPTDTISINEKHLCIHLSDIGMNAQLVKYFEENDMRGKMGYAKEIFRVLWRKRLMDVTIKSRERSIKRTAFMVVIANAGQYGTGARINPLSNIHDGMFEVIILRKLSIIELLKMLFYNRNFNPDKTEIFQANSLQITVKKKVYFQVDGEYLGKTKSISATVNHHALRLIFPK